MSRMIGKKRRLYSQSTLTEAVKLVRDDEMSLNKAATVFGIPKTTLHDRVHGKYSTDRVGPRRTLNDEEENRIADWAMHMAKIGYGRTRRELVMVVKKILDEDGRPTPFKNNTPGKDWLNAFFARHPQLSLRTTLQLGKERAIISPDKVSRWFSDFSAYIESEVKDQDLLKDPTRLYNADESGFSLCSTTGKVIGYRGAPVVYNFGNSSKQQLTVLACASASGHFCPPMIVYPGQRFNYEPLEGFEDAHMGRSDSGWMDAELFCHWLLTCFVPALESRSVKRPVILFIDGHSTHLSLDASNICVANGIELYCLLEHSSYVMQPLDLRLFATLKQNWKEALRSFQLENIGEFVNKRTFARVFKSAWEKSTTIDIAIKGFMEAGLYPLCPERVNQSVKLEPSRLFLPTPAIDTATCTDTNADTNAVTSVSHTSTGSDIPVRDEASVTAHPVLDTLSATAQFQSDTAETQSVPAETESAKAVADPASAEAEKVSTSSTAPESPFSKYLKYPQIPQSKGKRKRAQPTPKAITGRAYRTLLLEKKEQKEREIREKEIRKEERIRKKALREELKKQKKMERETAMLERRRKKAEKVLERALASDSEARNRMRMNS